MNADKEVFCTRCGVPRKRSTDKVCTECGSKFPEEHIQVQKNEQVNSSITQQPENNNQKRSNKKGKPILKPAILMTCAGLLLGGGISGYLYIKDTTGPEHVVNEAIVSMDKLDKKKFQQIANYDGIDKSSIGGYTENLLSSLDYYKDIEKKVKDSLKEQEKAIQNNEKTKPFILRLQEKKEKKWFVFKQYEIAFEPVSLSLAIPNNVTLEMDGKKVKPSGDSSTTLKTPVQGMHSFVAKNGEKEEKWSYDVWQQNSKDIEAEINSRIEAIASSTEATPVVAKNDTKQETKQEAKTKEEKGTNSKDSSTSGQQQGNQEANQQQTKASFSDSEVESQVLKIRAEYGNINNTQGNLQKTVDGKGATVYKDKNGVTRKKVVENAPDGGGKTEFYYWNDGKLFFSFSAHSGEEHRYYFQNDKMIRWIGMRATMNFEEGKSNEIYLEEEVKIKSLAY
ncbi:hypothetical protein bcgnr5369_11200 [Bacillus cereus]|uniref:Uncharacterized protein n=1 Tax=Bacillus thuringiensis TaxID=1428 RepID=A0A9X6WJ66_BACTU|nr:hypothetical protein [Bacillus thuringiensis]PFJ33211.1 hypothetical protein COJ15_28630 [Bacillus thuringiensis]